MSATWKLTLDQFPPFDLPLEYVLPTWQVYTGRTPSDVINRQVIKLPLAPVLSVPSVWR